MPEHVVRKLTKEYGGELRKCEVADQPTRGDLFSLDAIYVTPSTPHQLAMMPDISIQVELEKGVDAIYVTRFQRERHAQANGGDDIGKTYPVVDKRLLKEKTFKQTLVMHPLPRIDELAHELDADPRSMYFKQAARGVPVRMALISLLLGARKVEIPKANEPISRRKADYPVYNRGFGVRCQNRACVSVNEEKYIKAEFKIARRQPLTLTCAYCEHEIFPKYVASSEWHEGTLESKKYHSADSHWGRKIRLENLILFDSESEARSRGFKPGKYIHH
jgi:hypothetical protein